jgi:assimilatory nitrate reductase catalytic subunit
MVRTTCPYCGVGCGILAAADGAIAGDPEHPANRGRLCSKGAALGETLGSSGRMLRPEIHGRPVSWTAALDFIAQTLLRTMAAHGPDAIAFYVSGQLLTEDYYVANKLMKGFIGSANIDTNSRLCMASTVAGQIRAFGEDLVPGCYDDIEAADLVVLVGANMAWCHPVLYQRLAASREAHGTRIVVIDPRRTASCEIADLHLALRPGTDVAVFAGLLLHLAASGLGEAASIKTPATGFAAALEAARIAAPSPAAVAAIADLSVADLAQFYEWFAATERTLTLYSQGVNQSAAGTDKVNAIINCHLATGRIGRPGMGPLSLTGQPNAMGGREVGGLANQLAAHRGFAEADVDSVRRFWNAPRMARRPGLKAVDLFDAVRDGSVRALWIIGTNPAASMPRADRVREALGACPFVAVSDCWPTETTRFADVVFPVAGWGEKDGTATSSERRISRQRAFHAPPGEARPDWWVVSEVARRMGWGEAFRYRGPADIFREHAALSAFENEGHLVFNIGALAELSDQDYDDLRPVQWPLRRAKGCSGGTKRLFESRSKFPTEDGRACFVATPYRPLAEPGGREWPLVLNTGRVRDQWHTMTRTGRVPRLMTHCGEPLLDIHPEDAERAGLLAGDLARIESRHGSTVLRIRLSTGQRIGEVFAPMHWTDSFTSAGPVGRLVGAATDPVSGQPELKGTPVRVIPLPTFWRGSLLRRTAAPLAEGPYYWARMPLDTGQAFALAGWEPLPRSEDADAWFLVLLGASPTADLITYADPGRSAFRYARIIDGRLDACLFIAGRTAELPASEKLGAALGAEISADARLGLLAGSAGGRVPTDDARTICVCFGVGLGSLRREISARRLTSVSEIGSALRAGTNCGSCIPELKGILRDVRLEPAPAT